MNRTEYYKSKGQKAPSNFKKLFNAGYFGNATYDDKTRTYDIDPETPIPYTYEKKIEGVNKLSLELLEAARLTRSVFPSMFPRIQHQTVAHYIDLFVENGYIQRVDTGSGVQYLELSPQGTSFYEGLKKLPNKQRLENINLLLKTFAEPLGTALGAFWREASKTQQTT